MPFCDGCGQRCSEEEITVDTRGETEVRGPYAYSRIRQARFCPECAASRAKTGACMMWGFGGLILFLALLVVLSFFRKQ
jgi:hypothetical protein